MIFCAGSSRRALTRTGRRCSCRASSAMRAERFDERTAEKVAPANASVPPAVASDEIVTQSATRSTYATGPSPAASGAAPGVGPRDAASRRRLAEALRARADPRIVHDEPVRVERDVADEVTRAEANDAVSQRLVALLRHTDLQRRNLDPAHEIVAGRARF